MSNRKDWKAWKVAAKKPGKKNEEKDEEDKEKDGDGEETKGKSKRIRYERFSTSGDDIIVKDGVLYI